jgi:flagellar motor switch protein FliN/FliY
MTDASLNRELCAALVEELGIVVGALIDSTATVDTGALAAGRQWTVRVDAVGTLTGTVLIALDHEGTKSVTQVMTGIEGDIADETLVDTVRELMAQAVSALALKPVARGATLSVEDVSARSDRSAEGEWWAFHIGAEKLPVAMTVMTSGRLACVTATVADKPGSTPTSVPSVAGNAVDDRMDVILDIDLPLVVRFGRTELPLRAVTRLGPGSVIDLGRSPDDPVDVLVGNRVVARGEVVVVSGSYGIRIIDVVSPRDRMRSMEA